MKKLRSLLRNFPAKSSSLGVLEIKNETQKSLESETIKHSQAPVFDNNSINQSKLKNDDNLLGDLLFYLRTQKLMSTLMMCRQIEKIEIANDVAMLCSLSADLSELSTNEKHKMELDTFFRSKGLSFKIKENKKEVSPIENLREYFGDKLIIK